MTEINSSLLFASEKQPCDPQEVSVFRNLKSYVITGLFLKYYWTNTVTASQIGCSQLSPVPYSSLPSSTMGCTASLHPVERHAKCLKVPNWEKMGYSQFLRLYLPCWCMNPVSTQKDKKLPQIFPAPSFRLSWLLNLPLLSLQQSTSLHHQSSLWTRHLSPGSVSRTSIPIHGALPWSLPITQRPTKCSGSPNFLASRISWNIFIDWF